MREKYESLALVQLKELAKVRGLKGTSTMKKADLVEAMLAEDERLKKEEEAKAAEEKQEAAKSEEAEKPERTERPVRQERNYRQDRYDRQDRNDRNYRTDRTERTDRVERTDRSETGTEMVGVRSEAYTRERTFNPNNVAYDESQYPKELDSGIEASGILEVMPDGYGFIRCENYMPGENDVYVAPSQIRRFGLKTGDILKGNKRIKTQQEKFSALLFVKSINGYTVEESAKRMAFEDMTPIFPDERIKMETPGCSVAMRVMDLVSPVGKGQRGMIVSPPKAGKTTLLKEVAKSILNGNPKMHMLILLIDERPEEVTDMQRSIKGEVVYSTFDELPEHHTRVAEMVMERSMRLVEMGKDVVVLMDSITRLARAYNLTINSTGKTLSGGMDPGALHKPKRFFGAARNIEDGGSLTVIATALVETGSRMDDMVYEEFKGTGNMEIHLDRKLSEKRIFPAVDIYKSGTRREELLLTDDELDCVTRMRRMLSGGNTAEVTEQVINMLEKAPTNAEFCTLFKNYTAMYEKDGYMSAGRTPLRR